MKKYSKIHWKWLGIFLVGLIVWVLAIGLLSPITTNFIVSKLGAGNYAFVIYSLLSVFFAAIFLYYLYTKVHKDRFKIFGLTKEKLISDWLIGLITAVILASISIFIIIPYLGPEHETYIAAAKHVNTRPLVNIIIAGIVFGGFAEELFFRGHIITSISEITPGSKYLLAFSVILSAILFGFGHRYQGNFGIIFGFIHSIVYAILYIKRKSLISPMIAHALYDVSVAIGIKYLITF